MDVPLKNYLSALTLPSLREQRKSGSFFVAIRCSGNSLYQNDEEGVRVAR